MSIEFAVTRNVIHVRLIGAFDFSSQDQLQAVTAQVLAEKSASEVQVDLAKTSFMDSSTIRALLTMRQTAVAAGKTLALWNCNDKLREIFSVGGFDQIFEMR